jgi:nitroimidazol reductase NimA-like FMN-containing flavoprotein (pyridoxamine 5'-phosphate oxidase superfamily)
MSTMTVLSREECWTLLARERVGRLAYRLVDEVHVVPVNYAVRGESLLVATGEGNKLLAAELQAEAAVEIDDLAGEEAWSVLARGRLEHLPEDATDELDDVVASSWLRTLKYDVVRLVPTAVSGRRFALRRP